MNSVARVSGGLGGPGVGSYPGALGMGDTGVAPRWVVTRALLGLGCQSALGLGDTGMAYGIGSYQDAVGVGDTGVAPGLAQHQG